MPLAFALFPAVRIVQGVDVTLRLSAGDYLLELAPERGGSILRLDWRGQSLLRQACGPAITDTACFPLVPFSNRIAHGRFRAGNRVVSLARNLPGSDHPHPLHGFGWLSPWHLTVQEAASVTLELVCAAGEWPWPYRAQQVLALDEGGLDMVLTMTNLGDDAMPAGLGFHPYFPRSDDAIYTGLHQGEWHTDEDCLPLALDMRDAAIDWWQGCPIAARSVDTAYIGRQGPLRIAWLQRDLELLLEPSPELGTTVVFTPDKADFFCIEPASHAPNAHNRNGGAELRWLAPSDSFAVSLRLTASRISDQRSASA
jgi:aldose 1-epimerase